MLNAVVTSASISPTLTSVETLNLTAKYGTGGIALTNSTGYTAINVSSSITSGSASVTDVAEPVTVTAGTNIASLTVAAKATSGTGGLVSVNAGNATSVTLTGNTGADTFNAVMGVAGTLTVAGDSGNDTLTATLKNGTNTVTLNMGTGTDAATLNLAGGTLTLTGNTANETLNIVSTGAANTVNATATTSLTGTINVSGDQSLTLKDTQANLTGVTLTDTLTAGTTTVKLSATGASGDLSKIAADVIEVLAVTTTADDIKVASGATVKMSQDSTANAFNLVSATDASGTVNVDLAGDANIGKETADFATVAITVSDTGTAATALTAVFDTTDTTVTLAGLHAVTLANTSTAKVLNASGMSGVLTATANASLLNITGGSGNDAITIADADMGADVTVSTGAGDDTITLAGTGTMDNDADEALILDGGAGNDTLALSAAADFSATANLKTSVITGIETFDIGSNTLTLTQKQLFTNGTTVTVSGSGGTLAIVDDTASSNVFDISGLTFAGGVAAPTITVAGDATNANTMVGSTVADSITGGAAADTISAGTGADTVTSGGGADIITTGAGADSIVVSATGVIPSAANFITITDYNKTAGTSFDTISAAALILGAQTAVAGVGVATISTGGIATFNAADDTFAEHLAAVAAALQTTAGATAIWQEGADTYMYIADATLAVATTDTLIKLVGVTAGDMTIAANAITAMA